MRRIYGLAVLLLLGASPALGVVSEGQTAPNFTKPLLGGPPWSEGPTQSLSDYAGKIVILHLLGWG
jgi:hypothetical protein